MKVALLRPRKILNCWQRQCCRKLLFPWYNVISHAPIRSCLVERVSVTEAALHFDKLIDRVAAEGVTVELERNHTVVARLSPAGSWVRIADLNRVFASLPSLGDDAESFARDIETIRAESPPESDPWA